MEITFCSFSCDGPRDENQDRLLEPLKTSTGSWITAIADGVGGSSGGAEAAEIAIEAVKTSTGDMTTFDEVFKTAVSGMKERAETDPTFKKMASTLSAIIIEDGNAHIAHVGDARIYHLREKGLKSLTEDQTEVAELRKKNVLTEYQLRRYPRKNVLTSALSPREDYTIYHSSATIYAGDRIILLTDGVYQKITKREILELSERHQELEAFVESLREQTEKSNPSDNYSALALEFR
ncbi:PP2C family protein-serine/threonine phosphatase [Agrobacterium tumefaciens]|uniref:PP2C family protein-serine/threonine phosphatase n=1 Tax=Agrobacterium tumefaciens TaxID=358 RepID=UPI0015728F0E|nr:serine/threonine-protein phosphatase [Agrobacterium tumefaciens]